MATIGSNEPIYDFNFQAPDLRPDILRRPLSALTGVQMCIIRSQHHRTLNDQSMIL